MDFLGATLYLYTFIEIIRGFLAQIKKCSRSRLWRSSTNKAGTQRIPTSVLRGPRAPGILLRSNLRRQDCYTGMPSLSAQRSRSQELGAGITLVTNNLIVENYNFLSWVYQRWPQNSLWCGQKFFLPPQPLKIGQRHLLWNSQSRL